MTPDPADPARAWLIARAVTVTLLFRAIRSRAQSAVRLGGRVERIFPEGGVNYVVESHTAPATNQKARTNRSGPSGISPSELGLCAFEGADGLTYSTFEAYRAPYGC
jgi:hypothetical protein